MTTGEGLRRATVRAYSPVLASGRTTTTDRDGRYELSGLPPGRYSLIASKGGYVSSSYGQTRPFGSGKSLDIRDGQTVERVDFRLPPGGIIAGHVVDEIGEAFANVQVTALRRRYVSGRQQLTPVGSASTTNDIGEFRVFGLPPGQFYLSATPRPDGLDDGDFDSVDRASYARAYYPGTNDPVEASPIVVTTGQRSEVDMVLMPVRIAQLWGTALTSDGRRMTGGSVTLAQRSSVKALPISSTRVKSDGTFFIGSVPPGDYVLQMRTGEPTDNDMEVASAYVSISGGEDLPVQVVADKAVTATGRIILAGAAQGQVRAGSFRVTAFPIDADAADVRPPAGRVNDDLTFEVQVLPGHSIIGMTPVPLGWALRAVRLNGLDVTDVGIEFKAHQDVAGIEIELTSHPTRVSGLASDSRGQPAGDCLVVVFSSDTKRWGYMSRYLASVKTTQDGRFEIRSLPPGGYLIAALEDIEPGQQTNPDFLDTIQSRAKRFSLPDGGSAVVDVPLVSSR